ncbi:Fpg/Nei family DNA glycosylase [Tessaracoccus sp. MC1865]|uniref:Fpg/Nei family DNA glycosylase n=1 Tax=Tessaracoccus sp. MC1865 TaxID=2760310 RepID=UPI0015FF0FB5|nr:Fpg/Nei family DNA glycosylase [Tessaracoccus sp. MC1865]MBB1484416.1 Fpg/Nei family DNA glycosylase [Tessaracoccus sp. MC1865]QTO38479.1 Fpg/Nei family DNA glycosylase [Tessaracoccus sp. MC1865]
MPEGDTVWQLSQRLQPLVGRIIEHSDFRVPALATQSLVGTTIDRIWPYGKHLYWQCADRILHTHLRMDGTWRIHAVGAKWSAPAHTARLVIRVDGGVELVGHWLGVVELWPAGEYDRRTAHLGPDVLASDWHSPGRWDPTGRDEAVRRVSSRPERTIGEALLDQRNLAGLGNEYRVEVCFLQGLHPTTSVALCDVPAVVDLAAKLMRGNLTNPVRTFTGIHRRGENTFVFGRRHRPCRRCGTLIEASELGGGRSVADADVDQQRVIWWCPTCQPAP